ncbi:MAG: hypothetical protein FK733_00640 [Asgard group archaeon]|nr:hypothetical protein [Asgard group archaeon]
MEVETVKCPECGAEFSIDIPNGKRVTRFGKRRFQRFYTRQVTFRCPNCRINMWANYEDKE